MQEWEQGRMQPESAGRDYLTVIGGSPKALEKALTDKS
jgi:DNA-binding transcriptional regulator YiaG